MGCKLAMNLLTYCCKLSRILLIHNWKSGVAAINYHKHNILPLGMRSKEMNKWVHAVPRRHAFSGVHCIKYVRVYVSAQKGY